MNEIDDIAALYALDRAERKNHPRLGSPGYVELRKRDQERRKAVQRLLDRKRLTTGEDYYFAAWIFNHGDTPADAEQAHRLALEAVSLNYSAARWLAAASYDRWCMYRGEPQKFGTQYVSDGIRQRLWDVRPETTDEERAAWNVPPLSEQIQKAEEATRLDPPQEKITEAAPQWLKDALKRWGIPHSV
jgi:hypothetical protein